MVFSVYQTTVAFACVGSPDHAGIRRGLPGALRKGKGLYIVWRSCGITAPSRKRLAASEHELLSENFIVRAAVAGLVIHVFVQVVLEESTGMADGRVDGVGAEVGIVAEGEFFSQR